MKTLADIFGVKIEKDMVKKRPMRVEDIDCSSRLEKYFKEHNGKVKHGNNKMREQFEKLPEIANSLSQHIYFGDDNLYHSDLINFQKLVCWINGAWYAFQEQQKKLQHIYDDCTEYTTVSELLDSIRGLLK